MISLKSRYTVIDTLPQFTEADVKAEPGFYGASPGFAEERGGALMRMDWQTLHRASPATKRGWRWFARATRRVPNYLNEVRTQTQVYLSTLNQGW